MRNIIKLVMQWFQTPWPFFLSMAVSGVGALLISFLWMHNLESEQIPPVPLISSISDNLNEHQP